MSEVKIPTSLKILRQREYRILKAAVDCLVPEAEGVYGIDLADKIDSVLAKARGEIGRDFRLLLWILEYGTFLLGFTFRRFTKMSIGERACYLERWERSPIAFKRMGFQALKRSAMAAFYGSKQSWEEIGYRGPWLEQGFPHDYQGKGIQRPA